jgi:hypothetical protein
MAEEIISKLLNYLGDNYGLDYDDLGLTDEEIEYCKEIVEPHEFKVGEKVVYVGAYTDFALPPKGTVGVIQEVCKNNLLFVTWAENSGVGINPTCNSRTWYVSTYNVKFYKED